MRGGGLYEDFIEIEKVIVSFPVDVLIDLAFFDMVVELLVGFEGGEVISVGLVVVDEVDWLQRNDTLQRYKVRRFEEIGRV